LESREATAFRSGVHEEELAPGEARLVRLPAHIHQYRRDAIVLRTLDGALRAYLNECQHLPIPLDVTIDRLIDPEGTHLTCATHGACYRADDGLCIAGPCEGESLLAIPIESHAGEIVLRLRGD
jgi:nitrite reductase/ring-hydroxylating ferredoxin subunit